VGKGGCGGGGADDEGVLGRPTHFAWRVGRCMLHALPACVRCEVRGARCCESGMAPMTMIMRLGNGKLMLEGMVT
jgi:hypothetical protein